MVGIGIGIDIGSSGEGGGIVTLEDFNLLKEDGDAILQESGDFIFLDA